jgi:hypothetical protein
VHHFADLKLKLEYVRSVSQHEVTGKHYEASHCKFKALEQRSRDTDDPHAHLLLVLASQGTVYFERYSNFTGGKHSAPVIGIVEVEPMPVTVTVGSPLMEDLWSIWSTNDPTLTSVGMKHMRTAHLASTKPSPSPHSVHERVSRDNKDHVYMYKVVHSVNLEAYALTIQFQEGARG